MSLRAKNISVLLGLLFVVCLSVASSQEKTQTSFIILPTLDIPLTYDQNLFDASGGIEWSRTSPILRKPILFQGYRLGYHLGYLNHEDFDDLGTLSITSVEGNAGIKGSIRGEVDLFLSGGAGWYYAFENQDISSHASSWILSGGTGLGIHLDSGRIINVQAQYRYYNRLYHFLGLGFGINLSRSSSEAK